MSITWFSGRRKPWFVEVYRHKEHFRRSFQTKAEAIAVHRQIEKEFEVIYGPVKNRRLPVPSGGGIYFKNDYSGPRKKAPKVSPNTAPAPCGTIRESYRPERCKPSYQCPDYVKCLDVAYLSNWEGWVQA